MNDGICRLCGNKTKLSFEHLPPRSALNSEKTKMYSMMDWLNRETEAAKKGKQYQRGVGVEALCTSCNNNTGAWYVPDLSKLVHTGVHTLRQIPKDTLLELNQNTDVRIYGNFSIENARPLAIIKQVATMFFAMNNPKFRDVHSDLADFVLSKTATGLPAGYQFHLAFYIGPFTRYSNLNFILDTNTGIAQYVSEIAAPPFCYLLTIENQVCFAYGSINHYADYQYDEEVKLDIKTPVLVGNTPYALDFRSLDEVEKQRKKSEEAITARF